MKAIERRLADLEEQRPAFAIPQADTPVESLTLFEWLYLVVTLPVGDPHRTKLREARWSDTEFQRALANNRAMSAFWEALPVASRDLLIESLRIKDKDEEHAKAVATLGDSE